MNTPKRRTPAAKAASRAGASPAPVRALMRAARAAARRAYCPYSRFPVGAALLTADGRLFTGCNVENASYGLTICAERAAAAAAVAAGGRRPFRAIAIAGGTGRPALPCGACRQVLAEFGGPELRVYCAPLKGGGAKESHLLKDLLPHSFKLQRVGNGRMKR